MEVNRSEMILLKGSPETFNIAEMSFDRKGYRYSVSFLKSPKKYQYYSADVCFLRNPQRLLPEDTHIFLRGQLLNDVKDIQVFTGGGKVFYRVYYQSGVVGEYSASEVGIEKSVLSKEASSNKYEYLKRLSQISSLVNEEGEKLLVKQVEKIGFIGENSALGAYLSGKQKVNKKEYVPIFPFGCNSSQYEAVTNALKNQLSVIQGPPGTGKTQTILNILANLIVMGKTVLVVSNNNSATANVFDKLASPNIGMDFIVAKLGNTGNKKDFISEQTGVYPDFSEWKYSGNSATLLYEVKSISSRVHNCFSMQEECARLRQELSSIEVERKHFEQYIKESFVDKDLLRFRSTVSSKRIMMLWQKYQKRVNQEARVSFFEKVKAIVCWGLKDIKIFSCDISTVIASLQNAYYTKREEEITSEIVSLQNRIEEVAELVKNLNERSMLYLRDYLAKRYSGKTNRVFFSEEDLWKNPDRVTQEYPVILSTTFASRSSLHDVQFDYLIMDEASQVDIVTGALALSTAKHAVVVGDIKQLPNVLSSEDKTVAEEIFSQFNLPRGYSYCNSFLKSITEVVASVPNVLLKEHYRCHPKIINFCNQKFYNGELVIMTNDSNEPGVITCIKTKQGNHQRDHYNQRQIDVIREEILPQYKDKIDEVGIISPFRNQIEEIQKQIPYVEADTVHKFQGREKNVIIISTVDDKVSSFADDPFLLNVAVSRAKKKLYLLVPENIKEYDGNISDLVEYMEYNNCDIVDSKLYSIFDYLYDKYTEARLEYIGKHKRISVYESENLMFSLLEDVIEKNNFSELGIVCHFPLNMLIRNPEKLDDAECKYAMNPCTHLDFVIYNKITKRVALAIEVDGYTYHHAGTVQSQRDKLKDSIMSKYEIQFIRFSTIGSGEEAKILEALARKQ